MTNEYSQILNKTAIEDVGSVSDFKERLVSSEQEMSDFNEVFGRKVQNSVADLSKSLKKISDFKKAKKSHRITPTEATQV